MRRSLVIILIIFSLVFAAEIHAIVTTRTTITTPQQFDSLAGTAGHDSKSAIQSALNAGGYVYLPAGTYEISAGLTISRPTVMIGAGAGVAQIVQRTAGGSRGNFNDAPGHCLGIGITASNVVIRGLTITGPQNTTYSPHESGVYAMGESAGSPISDLTVEDCAITSWGQCGVKTIWVNGVKVKKNTIWNIGYMGIGLCSPVGFEVTDNTVHDISPGTSGNAYGITATSGTNNMSTDPSAMNGSIANNYVYNVQSWAGIDTHWGQSITISGNVIRKCYIGISTSVHAGTNGLNRIAITGNSVFADGLSPTYRGIVIGGAPGITSSDISISGNTVTGFGRSDFSEDYTVGGIVVQYARGVSIVGNVVDSSIQAGIALATNDLEAVVSGNVVVGLKAGRTYTGGILVAAGVTGYIAGNHVDAGSLTALYVATGARSAGLNFGPNNFISAGTPLSFAAGDIGSGIEMFGSTTWNPGAITPGSTATTTATVLGANSGDFVQVIPSTYIAGAVVLGQVSAGGTITIMVYNPTGGSITPGNLTWNLKVTKH